MRLEPATQAALLGRCPVCLHHRAKRRGACGGVALSRNVTSHTLCRVLDLQSPRWPAAQSCREEDSLRRPQRPGSSERAKRVRRNPPAIHPRELPEPLVCRNVPAVIQDIQRFAGSTLLEGRNLRKKKLMHICAEAVDDMNFLWKLLEK